MTPYDHWKLATPDYLENEDDRAISGVHSENVDEQDRSDLQQHLQSASENERQELDRRHQEDSASRESNKRQEVWTVDGPK